MNLAELIDYVKLLEERVRLLEAQLATNVTPLQPRKKKDQALEVLFPEKPSDD